MWPRRLVVLGLALLVLPVTAVAQGFTMGLAFGAVKPSTLDVTVGGSLTVRFPLADRVDLQLDLSGWTVTEPDVAQLHVGYDAAGGDVFQERTLDYPVSDLSLSVTPLVRFPVPGGFELVPGIGVGLHFVTSDLRRIETDGDSALRVGAQVRVALERFLSKAFGVSVGARFDLVSNVNQLKGVVGVLIRP
jgi:hypothetical protein